ncbi:DUF5131 family protein [Streptantibioticus ferralitis]|uniref:DUF5131 family protein n=1 Tax=Streptantibioticus ferralitis TaxID=236510 RepID=A0ABT5Z9S6_9ACTN|nr:DUF5131 family protein [Streptantibioticus ferralitis]
MSASGGVTARWTRSRPWARGRAAVADGGCPVSDRSAIEWTEATWNPTTGCDRVSSGCDSPGLPGCGRCTLSPARPRTPGVPSSYRPW